LCLAAFALVLLPLQESKIANKPPAARCCVPLVAYTHIKILSRPIDVIWVYFHRNFLIFILVFQQDLLFIPYFGFKEELKLYTIYSPPHHKDQIVRATKQQAEAEQAEFDGLTTE